MYETEYLPESEMYTRPVMTYRPGMYGDVVMNRESPYSNGDMYERQLKDDKMYYAPSNSSNPYELSTTRRLQNGRYTSTGPEKRVVLIPLDEEGYEMPEGYEEEERDSGLYDQPEKIREKKMREKRYMTPVLKEENEWRTSNQFRVTDEDRTPNPKNLQLPSGKNYYGSKPSPGGFYEAKKNRTSKGQKPNIDGRSTLNPNAPYDRFNPTATHKFNPAKCNCGGRIDHYHH